MLDQQTTSPTILLLLISAALAALGPALSATDEPPQTPEVSAEDAAAIRTTFDVFRSAIGIRHAEHALAEISEDSLRSFEIIRRMAIAGKRLKIMGLAPSSRLMVFILRLKLTQEQLEAMTAEDLFKTAVKNGWYGRAVVLNSKLDVVHGGFEEAKAQIISQSGPTPFHYSFVREGDSWKLNLDSLNELLDAVLADLWRSSEMDENRFIMHEAGKIAEKPVSDELWYPLNSTRRR